MRFPLFLTLLTIFWAWLSFELRKGSHKNDSFWKREAEANSVHKQPLDNLDYITIPIDSLPFFYGIDENLDEVQKTVTDLASQPIVNLSNYTNTELKLQYGPANLTRLSEYDQNFTVLVRTLYKWGELLSRLGYEKEAVQVLEFAVSIRSDVTAGYLLLGTLYQKQGTPEKIDTLILAASSLDTLLTDNLIKQLNALRSSRNV